MATISHFEVAKGTSLPLWSKNWRFRPLGHWGPPYISLTLNWREYRNLVYLWKYIILIFCTFKCLCWLFLTPSKNSFWILWHKKVIQFMQPFSITFSHYNLSQSNSKILIITVNNINSFKTVFERGKGWRWGEFKSMFLDRERESGIKERVLIFYKERIDVTDKFQTSVRIF